MGILHYHNTNTCFADKIRQRVLGVTSCQHLIFSTLLHFIKINATVADTTAYCEAWRKTEFIQLLKRLHANMLLT